ncbi:DNA glycosylase [Xylaria digitata]|nr:DNA glycosylase [Xylaria digitata]
MAKAIRSIGTKAVNDAANRRRSARRSTLETNEIAGEDGIGNKSGEIVKKNESEGINPPKATTKRGLEFTDSLPAAELRRSKRIKSDDAPKQNERLKGETTGKKVKMKKDVKLEDDRSLRPVKMETDGNDDDNDDKLATPSKLKAAVDLQAKKLKSYSQFAAAQQSPYPDFPRPWPAECKLAHRILVSLHGEQKRPEEMGLTTTAPTSRAGCGDSASVLDALVRTILSQNTSNANSSRAKLSMDAVYGGSDAWEAIAEGGEAKLAKAIESGGLASVKSKVILAILQQTREKYGTYSLDHLFHASSDEAMRELISFKGVGPKTASCVLLFCLCRPSFAVDTHVHRITGLLGWRPAAATRDQTHAHLDARIPDEDKYGLHVLLVQHGRECEECRAGGKSLGRCELRRAFRKGKIEGGGEAGDDEPQQIKAEEDDTDGDVKG